MSIENQVCEAIELIVNKSISEAGFDRTIQCTIKRCDNPANARYVCSYQDSLLYAYATSPDITYSDGTRVWVLVPQNDMTKTKTILGAVSNMSAENGESPEDEERYEYVGQNCANLGPCDLSSYRNHNYPADAPIMYRKVLYDADAGVNIAGIDSDALKVYLQEARSIVCGAIFRTALPVQQQYKGDYGLQFDLEFSSQSDGSPVVESLILNIDNMTGDPYRLTLGKRQWNMYNVDGANFIRVVRVSAFTRDFIYHKPDNQLTSADNDIFITNIELYAANELTEGELNGVYMSLQTPRGSFFSDKALESEFKTIVSEVRVRGRLIDADANNLQFYWFRENIRITPKSREYNKLGGRGWECLNDYNVIDEGNNQIEWIPYGDTWTVTFDAATARENVYKCVCNYNGNILSKEVTITNMRRETILKIESDLGTQFYYDIGRPTLTCVTGSGGSAINPNYSYYWGVENNEGNMQEMPSDTPQNKTDYIRYIAALNALQKLKNDVAAGTRFANEVSTEMDAAQDEVNNCKLLEIVSYNNNQRADASGIISYDPQFDIYGNKVYNINVANINQFSKFKCSVFANDYGRETYIGTASITLKNDYDTEDTYTLVINNGTQIFQYDEYGVSPAAKSKENPINIPMLTFTLFDNLGNQIEEKVIKTCEFEWRVPVENTMLSVKNTDASEEEIEADLTHRIYKQALFLDYGIDDKYYYDRQDNEIGLTLDYKGMTLKAHTNFTFLKQGENGTNGSDYTARIVPNSKSTNLPAYPTFSYYEGEYEGVFNFGPGAGDDESYRLNVSQTPPFQVQLFEAENLIWEGSSAKDSPVDDNGNLVTIKWEILKNKYTSKYSDVSQFSINSDTGVMTWDQGVKTSTPANILKCTVYYTDVSGGKNIMGERYCIYATLPIITVALDNHDDNVNLSLKKNTGFRYVEYTSDGVKPQYDDANPFELDVLQNINNSIENIAHVEGAHAVTYNWDRVSSVFDYSTNSAAVGNESNTNSFIDSHELEIRTKKPDLQGASTMEYRPVSTYLGLCVTNAVVCDVGWINGGRKIGHIHIPIHFYRNRYGLAELNDWDGNSIQVDEEGGYVLSPRVGAGKKEDDNTFTGALMGEVQEANRSVPDIGILGYNHGNRTFFVDAEDGSAHFGYNDGSIHIDPSGKKALIYSQNFWKEYDEKGKPKNYNYRNATNFRPANNGNAQGMLIDLTTPEMYWGNGTFYVTKDGYMHARTGGDIGGWGFDDHAIFSLDNRDEMSKQPSPTTIEDWHQAAKTGMNSIDEYDATNKNGSNSIVAPLPEKMKDVNDNTVQDETGAGTAATNKTIAFWAGKTGKAETQHRFYVTHDGYLRAREATIGSGNSNLIYIGKASDGSESEGNSAIYTINKSYKNKNKPGFYIGADGFGLGNTQTVTFYRGKAVNVETKLDETGIEGKGKDTEIYTKTADPDEEDKNTNVDNKSNDITQKQVSRFQIDKDGTFYAREGYIGTGRSGWYIGSSYLRNGNKTSYMDGNYGGVFIGTNGIGLGQGQMSAAGANDAVSPFYVSNTGYLHSKKGMIANWIITDYSLRTAGSQYDGTIFDEHDARRTNGTAYNKGIWSETGWESGDMYIGMNGMRLGSKFAVDPKGNLRCNMGMIGGWQIDDHSIKAVNAAGTEWLTLNSDGSIYNGASYEAANWGIKANGQAKFEGLTIDGRKLSLDMRSNSGTGYGGGSITGGTMGGTAISNGSMTGTALKNCTYQGSVGPYTMDWGLAITSIEGFTFDFAKGKASVKYNERSFIMAKEPPTVEGGHINIDLAMSNMAWTEIATNPTFGTLYCGDEQATLKRQHMYVLRDTTHDVRNSETIKTGSFNGALKVGHGGTGRTSFGKGNKIVLTNAESDTGALTWRAGSNGNKGVPVWIDNGVIKACEGPLTLNMNWSYLTANGGQSGTLYCNNGNILMGTLPVNRGGTGAINASGARSNLEAAKSGSLVNHHHSISISSHQHSYYTETGGPYYTGTGGSVSGNTGDTKA